MNHGRALALLIERQSKIAALLQSADALLVVGNPVDRAAMAALRWQLVRTLREYQLFKHQEIFDPLVAAGDAGIAHRADGMKDRCVAIGNTYLAHIDSWANGATMETWDTYVTQTRGVLAKITRHLDRERGEATDLLADVGKIRDRTRLAGSGSVAQG